jgi:hypothetical protein
MVLAHLTEHLGRSFTPGEIARALGGRSTGAIGNALTTLVDGGRVTCTHTRPRRFAATAGLPAGATSRPTTSTGTLATAGAAFHRCCVRPDRAAQRPALPPALADHADVAALQALRAAGMSCLLYGPPGTGKTAFRVRSACCSRLCYAVGGSCGG